MNPRYGPRASPTESSAKAFVTTVAVAGHLVRDVGGVLPAVAEKQLIGEQPFATVENGLPSEEEVVRGRGAVVAARFFHVGNQMVR